MRKAKSCGIILFNSKKYEKFLLMRHPKRYDIPKGHIEDNETELECALREFEEETGISPWDIKIDPQFHFKFIYYPRYKKFNFRRVEKTLIVFLAHMKKNRNIVLSEHIGYKWVKWAPPHRIQEKTIDPLLHSVMEYFKTSPYHINQKPMI